MKTLSAKEKEKQAFDAMKGDMRYTNHMQAPRLQKVVVSAGVGSFKDKKKIDVVLDRLTKITGQKPITRGAKKSIASFKTREGDIVGCQATLRGSRMYGFLDKLFNVALPRTKDFRGVPKMAVDEMGNISVSIRDNTVFPETSDEELRDVFGLAVTIVSTARGKKEGETFFCHLGLPFKRGK